MGEVASEETVSTNEGNSIAKNSTSSLQCVDQKKSSKTKEKDGAYGIATGKTRAVSQRHGGFRLEPSLHII